MGAVRNQETLDDLTRALEANAGDVADACSTIPCSVGWLKGWMRDDPKIEAAINDAIDTGATVLEHHMIKRATVGWKEPVFYKDEQIGSKRKFSDALLIKALESRKPDMYGKRMDVNQNVSITHMSDGELDKKIDMLLERTGLKALPAPDIAIDAEFTEIHELQLDDLL